MKYLDESFQLKKEVVLAVMSTVHYFDIFKHPLRESELLDMIHHYPVTPAELSDALAFLVNRSILQEFNGYFLPHGRFENISRRHEGFRRSEKCWKKALQQSRLISKFPFVRGVLISGSLSKGYMDEHSDIDYLIITQPGRLWFARTLLVLYKKIFLLNSHKFFCVNYFLDLKNLVLNDRNLFTATELLFAKPTYNSKLCSDLLNENPWTKEFYPSFKTGVDTVSTGEIPASGMKSVLERLFNNKTGDYLDEMCLKLSGYFWNKKFASMPREQFQRDMRSSRGVSKHHPNGFRDKILKEHRERMELFSQQLNREPDIRATKMQPA